MEYIVICLVALFVSGLTLFSGFGLGTLLMPAFALFFPLPIAIAATAVVHLANNLFKLALLGKFADKKIVLRFAVPAAVAAVFGALLLKTISDIEPLVEYDIGSREGKITVVKIAIAGLIAFFAILEQLPHFRNLSLPTKFIPLGGGLSGFFGGLSGHQGALRTAFLAKLGLTKQVLIGTMVVSAVIVDFSRLLIYGLTYFTEHFQELKDSGVVGPVLAGTLAAFLGAFIGSRLMQKVTLNTIHTIITVLLILLAIALGSGII
jgi:uncharacterized protein